MKPRNHTLACIAKQDPRRFRDRTVETERRKLIKSRARRKSEYRRELDR